MSKRYRPMLHIPHSPLERLLGVLTALGIIINIAITIWGLLILPAVIPTHYGFAGTPDAYGSKGNLLILPIISMLFAVLFSFLSRYPQIYNYPWQITVENAPRQYYLARLLLAWLAVEMVWMFCGLQWLLIRAAQSHPTGAIPLFALVIVVVLLVTILLYMRSAARAR